MNEPYKLIQLDEYTHKIESPTLLLMKKNFNIIGKISRFQNWQISLDGVGIDEISFEVNKYNDGILCPLWNDLTDLKVVEIRDFERFEISVSYTDDTKTVKKVHGKSLETELGQLRLYEFHVNDDEVMSMEKNNYNSYNFDSEGNFIPTVFYNENDKKHSLLHRVLADKAPHWSIGYVTPYIALDEEYQPEPCDSFQRTYTCNGESIYDFLMNTVAKECNVIFIFDTINRRINCYSLCDCIDQETGNVLVSGIGEDTNILISKTKLANEISISSDTDSVKNCFRIEGGDDVITNMVGVANVGGGNYIYEIPEWQYNDMSPELVERIKNYKILIDENEDAYYKSYTNLCKAYEELSNYESKMMPSTKLEDTTAKLQFESIVSKLSNSFVAVSNLNDYKNNSYYGVTNNIESYVNAILDSRYSLDVTAKSYNSVSKKWLGSFTITRDTNKSDTYTKDIEIQVQEDQETFATQKIEKELSKGSMLSLDNALSGKSLKECEDYFKQNYCLNRLQSFRDGYDQCRSILSQLNYSNSELYKSYNIKYQATSNAYDYRENQIKETQKTINQLEIDYTELQNKCNFKNYIGDYYNEFCSFVREDTYKNDNYISDGLSFDECIKKAKELLDVAKKEIRKSCMIQRTIEIPLNNLFALPEFKNFYSKFSFFNYIRIRTEDEILKVRLIGLNYGSESPEGINVTFSENIESVDGKIDSMSKTMNKLGSIATNFSSTALQAKQGSYAKNEIADLYNNGLNAAKTMLTTNDNNEVTITKSGIICKRMDNEGYYGDKQLKIVGNGIYMTYNAWEAVSMAIGEIEVENPITHNKTLAYGVIGENIIGKFTASETAYIGNEKGTVLIDGNGITLKNGVIQSANYIEATNEGSILDLTNGTFSFAGGKLKYDNSELKVEGTINATGGTFKNTITCDEGIISGGTLKGSYISGGHITIGNGNFEVDDSGKLSAKNATIEGDVIAKTFTYDDNDFKVELSSGLSISCKNESVDTSIYIYSNSNGKTVIFPNEIQLNSNLNSNNSVLIYHDGDGCHFNKQIYTEDNIYSKNICAIGGKYYADLDDRYNILGLDKTNDGKSRCYVGNADLDYGVIRGKTVNYSNSSGTTTLSDERLKNSFKNLDEFDDVFMSLTPTAFKYNNGTSNRFHFGFKAQDVRDSFLNNGFTTKDFGGFVQMSDNPENKDYCGVDDPMGLIYTEFTSWNTHMIQKTRKDLSFVLEEISNIKQQLNQLKGK